MVARKLKCCTSRGVKSLDWSQLISEILELVLSHSSLVDVVRCKAVCVWWRLVAQAYISASSGTLFCSTPWLMLYCNEDERDINSHCFFNLEEEKVYRIKTEHNDYCVGSCHGWLMLLDENADLYLLNPLSRSKIQLPSIVEIRKSAEDRLVLELRIKNFVKTYSYRTMNELQYGFYYRAVLSSDPSRDNNYVVALSYDYGSRLACWKSGEQTWTDLNGNRPDYYYLTFYNDLFYALSFDETAVEVWDLSNSSSNPPIKKMVVVLDYPVGRRHPITEICLDYPVGRRHPITEICAPENYLVESSGHLLLIARYIIVEGDTSELYPKKKPNEDYPEETMWFAVYKLDFDKMKWTEVKSLGDNVLFLDNNHSLSIPAWDGGVYKKNSIYFMEYLVDETTGKHEKKDDLRVFNLEDESIKHIYRTEKSKHFVSTLCWVVPNPR